MTNVIEINKITGQVLDYKTHNDNAPPSYSAPDTHFKKVLRFHANEFCPRCGGTGYIGEYKNIAAGRCFKCLPESRWQALLGEYVATGTDDKTGESVCEVRKVSPNMYPVTGYIVTDVGVPPLGKVTIFPTVEEACEFGRKTYGV